MKKFMFAYEDVSDDEFSSSTTFNIPTLEFLSTLPPSPRCTEQSKSQCDAFSSSSVPLETKIGPSNSNHPAQVTSFESIVSKVRVDSCEYPSTSRDLKRYLDTLIGRNSVKSISAKGMSDISKINRQDKIFVRSKRNKRDRLLEFRETSLTLILEESENEDSIRKELKTFSFGIAENKIPPIKVRRRWQISNEANDKRLYKLDKMKMEGQWVLEREMPGYIPPEKLINKRFRLPYPYNLQALTMRPTEEMVKMGQRVFPSRYQSANTSFRQPSPRNIISPRLSSPRNFLNNYAEQPKKHNQHEEERQPTLRYQRR